MKLSVIIPIYNEIHTLDTILGKVVKALPQIVKEIILVDDFSTDGTREWLREKLAKKQNLLPRLNSKVENKTETTQSSCDNSDSWTTDPTNSNVVLTQAPSVSYKVIYHERNLGKGAALQSGFEIATGDVLVIQDADLEYDPQDWDKMWRIIAEGHGDIVYGSRFYGDPHRVLYFHHLLGNKVISNLINLLCNTALSDIEVCYKMFRREVLEDLRLSCHDFGFEVEFTVKVTQSLHRWRIYETGIAYYGRTYDQGKKISWRDGIKALWYIFRFRFFG